MTIDLSIPLLERGTGGVPSTTYTNINLRDWAMSCDFSIVAKGGFESLHVSCVADEEIALNALLYWLMRHTIVTSPDAEICWEGALTQIDATFGQERRSMSVEGMANALIVRYTTVLGTPDRYPTSGRLSDTDSQALYGVRDAILSVGKSDSTEAAEYAAVELARRKDPRKRPTTTVGTGELGGVQLDLTFTGWYFLLDCLTTAVTTTTKVAINTQLATLIAAYNAVNNFFSTSTLRITSGGNSVTQKIEPDTTYRAAIEDRMRRGYGSDYSAWGVYEDREFVAKPWAGADPDTITYQRDNGSGAIYDANGGMVPPWNIRPDTMYQNTSLLDPSPVSGAQDAAARHYVARTVCRIDQSGASVDLESEDPADLSAILIRKH